MSPIGIGVVEKCFLIKLKKYNVSARQINICSDGSIIEYDQGKFDDWCVYLTRPNQLRFAPRDDQYFQFFQLLAAQYGSQQVYDDFVIIYSLTSKVILPNVLSTITQLASKYGTQRNDVELWYKIVYAGMVAEENKQYSKLGKRIKRLGMHQVIVQNIAPNVAANFSKGQPWRDLDLIMQQLGF